MDRYLTEAMQDERELADLCALVRGEGVRSFLEIGAKFGGTTWAVGSAMPEYSRIVTIDLPAGTKLWRETEPSLKGAHAALRVQFGHSTAPIWGNSQDPKVIDQVRALGPFDLILIDGDHRLDGCIKDWDVYASMGRMIAFHDVAWFRAADWQGTRIDVPQLWNNLRPQYRHVEFRHDPSFKNNGIGVLWRD